MYKHISITVVVALLAAVVFRNLQAYVDNIVITTKPNTSYDYIIIGAGSAGSVIASRLSENENISILLVEAGGSDNSKSFHVPARMFENLFTEYNWNYPLTKPKRAQNLRPPEAEELIAAGRVLGGGANLNFMQYTRGSRYDYDNWERMGCKGWAYKDVLPYFKKSEDVQFEADDKYHSTGGFLGVSESSHKDAFEYLSKAGNELGLKTTDHNAETDLGVSKYYNTIKNGVRSSPSIHILRQAMRRPNLHVILNTLTKKVLIKEGKAYGVEIERNGKTETVNARIETIVSAGTIGSPKLLMLSGIGPEKELKQHGIPVVKDLPVGLNLKCHPTIPLWISTNRSDFAAIFPTVSDKVEYTLLKSGMLSDSVIGGGVIFTRMDGQNKGVPDVQIDMSTVRTLPDIFGVRDHPNLVKGPGFSFIFFISHPNSVGAVNLRSADVHDMPLVDLNYFEDDRDVEVGIFTIRFIKKLLKTSPMTSINASIELSRLKYCEQEIFDSDKYWDCFIRQALVSYHHTGTCKMGAADDPTTVVDPLLKVKGIKRLRVVDASIMPIEPSGNTNAPVIMVAEKAADLILRDFKLFAKHYV